MKRDVRSQFLPELDPRCSIPLTIFIPLVEGINAGEYPLDNGGEDPVVVSEEEAISRAYAYTKLTPCGAFVLRQDEGCQIACVKGKCKSPADERILLVEEAVKRSGKPAA